MLFLDFGFLGGIVCYQSLITQCGRGSKTISQKTPQLFVPKRCPTPRFSSPYSGDFSCQMTSYAKPESVVAKANGESVSFVKCLMFVVSELVLLGKVDQALENLKTIFSKNRQYRIWVIGHEQAAIKYLELAIVSKHKKFRNVKEVMNNFRQICQVSNNIVSL